MEREKKVPKESGYWDFSHRHIGSLEDRRMGISMRKVPGMIWTIRLRRHVAKIE
jgi:hypothetical protein